MPLEPLKQKWEAFNWHVQEIDGHNFEEIDASLKRIPFSIGKPSVIIAKTVKGNGVSFMENNLEWHYRSPNHEQFAAAIKELS